MMVPLHIISVLHTFPVYFPFTPKELGPPYSLFKKNLMASGRRDSTGVSSYQLKYHWETLLSAESEVAYL